MLQDHGYGYSVARCGLSTLNKDHDDDDDDDVYTPSFRWVFIPSTHRGMAEAE